MGELRTSASMTEDSIRATDSPAAQTSPSGCASGVGISSSHSDKLQWFELCFRPHFESSVFDPIDRPVSSDDALIGFLLMACAIDYLAGFWRGESTKGKVSEAYRGFIDEYFPPDRFDSDGPYDSLRNGLVQMFTIKGKRYSLKHNRPGVHLRTAHSGQIILNAADFRDDLPSAANSYFEDVELDPALLDKLLRRCRRDGFLALHPIRLT